MEPGPCIAGQATLLDKRTFGGREYRFYRVPDAGRILDEIDPEEWARDESMPYWAELWHSGILLASLLAQDESLSGARFLELGCGLGLPSLVAAHNGAHVTATDHAPEALELLQINARLSGVALTTACLDWRRPGEIDSFKVVAAADVLYEPWQTDVVVELLGNVVATDGRAIVVDPDRLTARGFRDAATYRGFRVKCRDARVPGFDGTLSVYELAWEEKWRPPR